jgi:transcriptional regulator with XRE-family HTH domain/tetratricopeptide (TPR) repeat protein
VGQRGPVAVHYGNPKLREARIRRGWTEDDLAVKLHELAAELGEADCAVDANQVSKWERGVRNPGRFYRPRLCLALEAEPQELGFEPTPRAVRDASELRMRLMKRRVFLAQTALLAGSLAIPAPGVNITRIAAAMTLRPGRDVHLHHDLLRIAAGLSQQLDMVAPSSLMPQVLGLLQQERDLLRERSATRLVEATIRTAITAGWLSYNINNRGDAEAYWSYAESLAREIGSNQLLAYCLGVRSSVYSAVPKRAGLPLDAAASMSLLEHAISLARVSPSLALRAWLYARRAEEHAVVGSKQAAYSDVERAYKVVGRNHLGSDDFPILPTWRDARLTRYHGSVAQLVQDYKQAISILTETLDALNPAYLPQRAMALTDLATAHAHLPQPEVEFASQLLGQAHAIAAPAGLGEATRRVMEARHQLQQWADSPSVRRLDEQLRPI